MNTPDPAAGLREAAANVSDRRTILDDGFWVSRKEMRALDLALGRPDMGTAALADTEPGLDDMLGSLDEDDLMYDYPVSQTGEPMDPVLFVRWEAIAALATPRRPSPRALRQGRPSEPFDPEAGIDQRDSADRAAAPANPPGLREAAERHVAVAHHNRRCFIRLASGDIQPCICGLTDLRAALAADEPGLDERSRDDILAAYVLSQPPDPTESGLPLPEETNDLAYSRGWADGHASALAEPDPNNGVCPVCHNLFREVGHAYDCPLAADEPGLHCAGCEGWTSSGSKCEGVLAARLPEPEGAITDTARAGLLAVRDDRLSVKEALLREALIREAMSLGRSTSHGAEVVALSQVRRVIDEVFAATPDGAADEPVPYDLDDHANREGVPRGDVG